MVSLVSLLEKDVSQIEMVFGFVRDPKFDIERQAFDKKLCPLYHGVVEVCSCHKTLVRHVGTRFSPKPVKVANCIIQKHFLQNLLLVLSSLWQS